MKQIYYYAGSQNAWYGYNMGSEQFEKVNGNLPAAVKLGCGECIPGYNLANNNVCEKNICNCPHGVIATGAACKVDQANICSSCSTGYYLDISTCKPCTDTCSPGKTHFTGCGGVSSGTCVPNATCPDGSSFKDFGNDTQGYFCCTGGKDKFISTIPSCGGKDNKGNPGNSGMCIVLIPDGKTKADVDCGGTLETCTWPITPADKI